MRERRGSGVWAEKGLYGIINNTCERALKTRERRTRDWGRHIIHANTTSLKETGRTRGYFLRGKNRPDCQPPPPPGWDTFSTCLWRRRHVIRYTYIHTYIFLQTISWPTIVFSVSRSLYLYYLWPVATLSSSSWWATRLYSLSLEPSLWQRQIWESY